MRYLVVFLISLFTLLLEFLQVRIFSFQYWYHLAYFIITMALLGITVSGAILSFSERLKKMSEERFYTLCFFGFAVSTSLGTFIISFLRGDFFSFWQGIGGIFSLTAAYLLAMIPYVFFGLVLSRAWMDYPNNAGRIYFFNLSGSALGVLAFIGLLRPLGVERLLQIMTVLSLLLYLILGFCLRSAPAAPRLRIGFLTFCIFFLSLFAVFSLSILPDKNKLYWTWFNSKNEKVFKEWNPVARIDVVKNPANGNLAILNDGDAQTPLISADLKNLGSNLLDGVTHRDVIFIARGRDKALGKVLVIGSGGGADVLVAYKYGAEEIDAVEINSTTARLTRKEFASVIGDIFGQPSVHLFVEDGRSFVKKVDRKYDAIIIFAVDSFAALNAGAYVMSENYPYTLEAFRDYWNHLDDDGLIQVSRFYYPQAPRETLRIFTTFYEALVQEGIKEPEKHIVVLANTEEVANPFASTIVSKRPISRDVIARFNAWFREDSPGLGFLFPQRSPRIGETGHRVFKAFVESRNKDEFYDNYYFDVKPTTDDKPFFYQYAKFSNLFKPVKVPGDVIYFNNIRGRWPLLVIFSLLIQTSAIVFILVFFSLRRLKIKLGVWLYPLGYFCTLGAGFMFLELALIQKMILFLGHPVYSMSAVIPALLAGVGIGSLVSSKISLKRQRSMIIFPVIIILVLAAFFSSAYLNLLLSLSLKSALVVSLVGLVFLGFFLGIPFPSGIARLSKHQRLIPVAWAVNGGLSVVGSVLAIILAMNFGFVFVMVISSIFYLAAFLLMTIWDRRI